MIKEETLDNMSFGQLSQALDYVLEKIDKIEASRSEGNNESVIDMLCVIANQIVMHMDAIVRQNAHAYPEALAQWSKAMEGYEERFSKYSDFFLDEDTLLDLERPETS